jgi:hypothetical protein
MKLYDLYRKYCRKNHCSCFIDGIGRWYWGDCCREHDKDYVRSGISREEADKKLFRCVRKRTNVILASVMYLAVRAGALSVWNILKWRRDNDEARKRSQ